MAKSVTVKIISDTTKRNMGHLAGIVILTAACVGLSLVTPVVFKMIIDVILPQGKYNMLLGFVGLLIGVPVLCSFIENWRNKEFYYLSNEIVQTLRRDTFIACLKMKICCIERIGAQKLMQLITRGCGRISEVLLSDSILIVTNLLQLIGVAVVLFRFNYIIACACLCISPLLFFLMKYSRGSIKKTQTDFYNILNEGEQNILEALLGARTVKAFGGYTYEENKMADWLNRHYTIFLKAKKVHEYVRKILPEMLNQIMYGIIFLLCVYLFIKSDITMGELVAVIAYVPKIFSAITGLLSIQLSYKAVENVIHELDEVYSLPADGKGRLCGAPHNEVIVFKDVAFSYGRSEFCLRTSFSVRENEFVAIVGESGCGKSTVIDLLLKYYEPQNGQILFRGTDIAEFDTNRLRSEVAVVSQDCFLWNTTLMNNIIYPDVSAKPERYKEAVEKAALTDFIQGLPQKDDTMISVFAGNISGGEKQRIAIARAVYRDFDILVLDEPTSALDVITAEKIHQYLKSIKGKKTVIMITHRLEFVREADKILVMKQGKIIEQGNYEALMEKHEAFYDMIYKDKCE